jgi:hypothetical protein
MSWYKSSLGDFAKIARQELEIFKKQQPVRYYPVFLLYAFSLIGLLKIAKTIGIY